jgi:hypothetical protein
LAASCQLTDIEAVIDDTYCEMDKNLDGFKNSDEFKALVGTGIILMISISADGSVILPSDVGDAVADDVAMEEE